uniref:Ubiquitin-like protease family profile domain-containing protein n=1 Tax=Setaria italica TaxID=4555 RepID=K3ZF59_SETIT
MRRVSAYIAYMMLKWQDRHYIWTPYNLRAYQHYITNGGIHNPKKPKEMVVRTNFPCHKQPSGSVHCGYDVCEHIRMLGRYATDPEHQQLLNIGADLCRFILREVVNPMGTYYRPEYKLAQEDKYVSLREWENQEYR